MGNSDFILRLPKDRLKRSDIEAIVNVLVNISENYARESDFRKAKNSYEKALKFLTENDCEKDENKGMIARVNVKLGSMYEKSGSFEKAADCYKKALELAPGSGDAYISYGSLLKRIDKDKKTGYNSENNDDEHESNKINETKINETDENPIMKEVKSIDMNPSGVLKSESDYSDESYGGTLTASDRVDRGGLTKKRRHKTKRKKPPDKKQMLLLEKEAEKDFKDKKDEKREFSRISVIGVGGSGNNTIYRAYMSGALNTEKIEDGSIKLWSLNTDASDLIHKTTLNNQRIKEINRALLGAKLQGGAGAGGDFNTGAQCARIDGERIKGIVAGCEIVVLIAGIGGGTGGGATSVISEIVKNTKTTTESGGSGSPLLITIANLPFDVEGKIKKDNTELALAQIKKYSDTIVLVDNNVVRSVFGNVPVNDAFSAVDIVISKFIRTLTDTVLGSGMINLEVSQIREIFKGGCVSVLGIGSGTGLNKVNSALDESLQNILYKTSPEMAGHVLVNVICDADTEKHEIDLIYDKIRNIYKGRDIIMCATKNYNYKDRIDVIMMFVDVPQDGAAFYETSTEQVDVRHEIMEGKLQEV